MRLPTTLLLIVAVTCLPALAQPPERPQFAPLLYLSFDGSTEPLVSEGQVAVSGGNGLEFVEGRAGQGAHFGDGQWVQYEGLPALDPKSGTIEIWVKPAFTEYDLSDHPYLWLTNDDGSSGLELKFASTHCGPRLDLWNGERRENLHSDFANKQDQWNHLVLTWDHYADDLWGLRFYYNGASRRFQDFREIEPPTRLRIGHREGGEATDPNAVLDEIAIYNRALGEQQVLELYRAAAEGREAKLALIRERVAAEDAERARRLEVFRTQRKFGMVVGRTIIGWNDEVFGERYGIQVPDRIDEKAVETTDLSQYDVLLFPGGGGFALTDAGAEALRQYIRQGGGFLGICAGCYAAEKYGLLEREIYPFRERGSVEVALREHAVTEGYNTSRMMYIAHANGPLIAPGDAAEDIVVYKVGSPGYVCAVARQYGEGRVVAFSGHPESTAETRRMVLNSLYWAAKVTAVQEQAAAAAP